MSRQHLAKAQRRSPEVEKLRRMYEAARAKLFDSPLEHAVATLIAKRVWPEANKAVSLGLGSLSDRDQSRRMKQLALFIAIAEAHSITNNRPIDLYAQDPAFTKLDEAFLRSLDIRVLRTTEASKLGEAKAIIDEHTLVYTPFLTLQAYAALLDAPRIRYLVSDDFNALREQWPRQSADRKEVEGLMKQRISEYRRRQFPGGDFWTSEDKSFPMAVYTRNPVVKTD